MKTVLELQRDQKTGNSSYAGQMGRWTNSNGVWPLSAIHTGDAPKIGDELEMENSRGSREKCAKITGVEIVGQDRRGWMQWPSYQYFLIAKVEVEWDENHLLQPDTEMTLAPAAFVV